MFCEESLGKVNAKDLELFRNRLIGPRILLPKSGDYFGTSSRVKEES